MKKALRDAPGKVLLLCSEFAYPLMQTVLSGMALPEDAWDLIYVPNITLAAQSAQPVCSAAMTMFKLSGIIVIIIYTRLLWPSREKALTISALI